MMPEKAFLVSQHWSLKTYRDTLERPVCLKSFLVSSLVEQGFAVGMPERVLCASKENASSMLDTVINSDRFSVL